jgi:hypothetical protein
MAEVSGAVRSAALHEAAHCLAARSFGWRLEGVNLDRARLAQVYAGSIEGPYEKAVVALAGREATWLFAESEPAVAAQLVDVPPPDFEDPAVVAETTRATGRYGMEPGETEGDDLDRAEKAVYAVALSEDEAEGLLTAARARARALVREYRDVIAGLAEKLALDGALDGDELLEYFELVEGETADA